VTSHSPIYRLHYFCTWANNRHFALRQKRRVIGCTWTCYCCQQHISVCSGSLLRSVGNVENSEFRWISIRISIFPDRIKLLHRPMCRMVIRWPLRHLSLLHDTELLKKLTYLNIYFTRIFINQLVKNYKKVKTYGYNIKVGIKDMWTMGVTSMHLDRVRNFATNPRVPRKTAIFLTSWVTISFSVRTVRHAVC
jgi:hypothetical protein